MAKNDLLRRNDQRPMTANGELVPVASVVQISRLTVAGPYSGDFQITNGGRLIVGDDPDAGARIIVSNSGQFGYSSNGTQTFSLYTATTGNHAPGDLHLGNLAANYLLYQQATGTLGLYTPQGAGFIAQRDGTLQAGLATGAHMLWNAADEALQVRFGSDVKINLGADGNASFDGTIYANGGRIYGLMVVDDVLRAGDVDGPAVYLGKFVRENANGEKIETSEIMAMDTDNLPWFHVVAGGETLPGYFHLGGTGDYDQQLNYDGTTLALDGTIRASSGTIGGWTIGDTGLTSATGDVQLDSTSGIHLYAYDSNKGSGDQLNRYSFVHPTGDVPLGWLETFYANTTISTYLKNTSVASGIASKVTIQSLAPADELSEIWLDAYGGANNATVRIARTAAGERQIYLGATGGIIEIYAGTTKFIASSGSPDYAQFDTNGVQTFAGSAHIVPKLAVRTETADYNATATDAVIVCNKATAMTVTLPAATGSGKWYAISSIGVGAVTIDGNASETIDGQTTQVIGQWDTCQIVDYTSGAWKII